MTINERLPDGSKLCLNCGKPFIRPRMWSAQYCNDTCKGKLRWINRNKMAINTLAERKLLSRNQIFLRLSKMRDHLDHTYYCSAVNLTEPEKQNFFTACNALHDLSKAVGYLILDKRKNEINS